ncbi:MAG: asparagine synthase (glutamine-hydrolyzing) [Acidobacteria bacterium]|nr:asparagine synthase (glutamine-hydrolyzing) [Acidobacteriota bacterium]
MCGIVGFNWRDPDLVSRMATRISHRGPDQHGTYVDDRVSLGFRRLSIIDLSERGRQPMANGGCQFRRGSAQIIFNGEIYNFAEVREELEKRGHTFHSQTDTEVILHAYEDDGVDCLKRLNGMFAVAIWDPDAGQIFVARDRMGKKPLYYYTKGGKFIFSSEIKAILDCPAVERDIDRESLGLFLGHEFIPAPRTIFQDIHKLPAGHYLVAKNGSVEVHRYWDLRFSPSQMTQQECEEGLRDAIDAAVKRRLRSDVPLGVFLSGGIDSSTIVAFMSRHFPGKIRTFSLGYRDKSYTELQYAKLVADRFGTEHAELLIDPVSPEIVEKVVYHADEPFSEFSVLPFYLICQKAREHVTVCLSGEGGDEVFVGYDRFLASKFDRYYRRIPSLLRLKLLHPLVMRFGDQDEKKGIWNVAKRFVQGSQLDPAGLHMRWQYFLERKDAERLLSPQFAGAVMADPFLPIRAMTGNGAFATELDRELYVEMRFMMAENPLMRTDKMSMAHALEVRAPLLDYELIDFVGRIPSRLKLQGWTTKAILKSALKGILPPEILYRKKQGYSFPIKHWLRHEMRDYMMQTFRESSFLSDYISTSALNDLEREHDDGSQNHSHILWGLMIFAIWHRTFLPSH